MPSAVSQGNMQQEYMTFMAKKPDLDQFETELKKYVDLEREIAHIAPVHNIGALSLETAPLKYSLRSECSAWKGLYGENLHQQARGSRNRFVSQICVAPFTPPPSRHATPHVTPHVPSHATPHVTPHVPLDHASPTVTHAASRDPRRRSSLKPS